MVVTRPYFSKEFPLEELQKLFASYTTKIERNEKIRKAVALGYSQNAIANVLKVTQGTISHVLRKSRDEN